MFRISLVLNVVGMSYIYNLVTIKTKHLQYVLLTLQCDVPYESQNIHRIDVGNIKCLVGYVFLHFFFF